MNPESERFIELATRPLEPNAELKLAAAGELRRRIEAHPVAPGSVAAAIDALEDADRHPRRRYGRLALYLTTLLVSLPLLVQSLRQLREFTYVRSVLSMFDTFSEPGPNPIRQRLSPPQRLLLFGEESAGSPAARWKPLWDSAPDNPAFLAQYAAAYYSDHKNLSPEILAAAERIDPANGWFLTLSAASLADGAVTKGTLTIKERKAFKTPVWKINDPKKLKESLALIHQAVEKPELRNYENDLSRQRIPLLPKRIDCVSQIAPIAYIASQPTAVIHLRKLLDVMCAGAQQCAADHDAAGFQQIVADWDKLGSRQIANGRTLIDLLVARVFYLGAAENFRDAAQALGLDHETARFSKLLETKKAEKEARDQRSHGAESIASFRGSYFATTGIPMVQRQVQNPPPLAEEDLRPGRYAEHALFMRASALAAWILFGLCAGAAALYRFLPNPLVRLQSIRILDLLKRSDWLWILAGGILAPVLCYLLFIYLTPLSSREWAFQTDSGRQALSQFASMVLLTLVLSAVICGARLARRGAFLGLTPRFAWCGWVAALCAALALPVSGSVLPLAFSQSPLREFSEILAWLSYALLALPAIWLLVGAVLSLSNRPLHALRRATLARMVLPAWIFAMLVMIVSMPFHHANERHWIQQDRLFEISADKPAMTAFEWEVTQQLRKELLEMMR